MKRKHHWTLHYVRVPTSHDKGNWFGVKRSCRGGSILRITRWHYTSGEVIRDLLRR